MSISKLPASASLKDVMDKFEEISLQDFPSIDIITASELPDKVKENQIVCITNITANKFIISVDSPEQIANNDIWIKNHSTDNFVGEVRNVKTSNKLIKILIKEIYQLIETDYVLLDAYVGRNGEWVKLTNEFFVFNNGQYENIDITGKFLSKGSSSCAFQNPSSEGTLRILHQSSGSQSKIAIMTGAFDVTAYSQLIIECEFNKTASTNTKYTWNAMFGLHNLSGYNTDFTAYNQVTSNPTLTGTGKLLCKLDVGNLAGLYGVKIYSSLSEAYRSGTVDIYSIKFL